MKSPFIRTAIIAALLYQITCTTPAAAADTKAVRNAINKGVAAILSEIGKKEGAKKTLSALAAYKGGASKDHPAIQEAIHEVLDAFKDGEYKPGGEHIYEAGIQATLLADVDGEKYREQLIMLRDYLVRTQQTNGGWNYPSRDQNDTGDTSVIQYGCLGLWAIERAAIEVDRKVWGNVLNWHANNQNADGGFAYYPGRTEGALKGASELTMSINAVGSMHIAMLHLSPEFLPLSNNKSKAAAKSSDEEKKDESKFGVLEKVEIDTTANQANTQVSIPPASVNAVRRAHGFVVPRFRTVNDETQHHKAYYYYSLERMASLANIETLGSHKWFDECADFLISRQEADGHWAIGSVAPHNEHDTAFAVLFLTRSTGKLLKRVPPPDPVGDGLLAGGRGLPDDLSDAQYDGRSMKEKPKPTEPLDKLLASLSSTGDIDVADVQKQIVQNVQLGDRETLIGQIDQLVTLVDHPDPEVRRTVSWALGRTDDMQLAEHLILGLSDNDLGVMIESRNALCWLARKPKGFGLPENPLDEIAANATEQQKSDAIAGWHKQVVLRWGQWYLSNRPFKDRGDEFESKLRADIERLKSGG